MYTMQFYPKIMISRRWSLRVVDTIRFFLIFVQIIFAFTNHWTICLTWCFITFSPFLPVSACVTQNLEPPFPSPPKPLSDKSLHETSLTLRQNKHHQLRLDIVLKIPSTKTSFSALTIHVKPSITPKQSADGILVKSTRRRT